jgi:hypothetical protein
MKYESRMKGLKQKYRHLNGKVPEHSYDNRELKQLGKNQMLSRYAYYKLKQEINLEKLLSTIDEMKQLQVVYADLKRSGNDGEEIKVQFNLRGREWNGPQGIKYFNTLEAWRIEKVSGGNSSAPSSQNSNQASNNTINTSSAPVFTGNVGDNDDLPF